MLHDVAWLLLCPSLSITGVGLIGASQCHAGAAKAGKAPGRHSWRRQWCTETALGGGADIADIATIGYPFLLDSVRCVRKEMGSRKWMDVNGTRLSRLSHTYVCQAGATVHYEKRVASLDLQSGLWRARPFEGAPGWICDFELAVQSVPPVCYSKACLTPCSSQSLGVV